MPSLRDAAELLVRARLLRDLEPVARHLGFSPPLPLDAAARRDLGLGPAVRRANVAVGAGTLRSLMVELRAGTGARDEVSRTARHLAKRSPELLWLVLAVEPGARAVVIAAPGAGDPTRVCALAIDTARVVDSDAETFAALAAAAVGPDLLVHHRWRELLGRGALSRQFYRELERVVLEMAASARGGARDDARREISLLYASRLLFLAFLQAKGWLDGDREFLRRAFDERCMHGGDVHRRLLEPLFFGTLNTPMRRRATAARALGRIPFLNGGLFARTPVEKRHRSLHFPDESVGSLIGGLLGRYRVTAREDSSAWSEAAIDPEMLGRAFESLMASADRRASGAFYTPRVIIARMAGESIDVTLAARGLPAEVCRAARDGHALPLQERGRLQRALDDLRVLDPACGSGAFLVHVLEQLAELARVAGDARPVDERRRMALTRSIFGVDVNPTAVWLCELRLWLSVVIESGEDDPQRVTPLPNLDRNIRVGDALAGAAFDGPPPHATATLELLRTRYARSSGARKCSLARALDRAERSVALAAARRDVERLAARRRELLCTLRSRDLFAARALPGAAQRRELVALRSAARDARRRIGALAAGAPPPFAFSVHFANVLAAGGFDLVIGNPPWVRLHHIPRTMRAALRDRYRSFREAAWMPGAKEAAAGRGFAAQADLSSLFVERALALARPHGCAALLLPAKLWRSLSGGGVRAVIAEQADLHALEDWSESEAAFDAVVYPSFLLASRRPPGVQPEGPILRAAVHRRRGQLAWRMPAAALALDDTPGSPWLLLPPDVRAGFDRLQSHGVPLARSSLGRPLLGVKSGCNEAFLVTPRPGWREAGLERWPVRAGTREGAVEAGMLRRALRGESVRAWVPQDDHVGMLWTHDALDAPRPSLPPGAAEWLAPWRRQLEARSDLGSRGRWWALFRTESARSDRPRVVWSDIGKAPRALVLRAGDTTVPLNSCYAVHTRSHDDALAFCALLNSPVAAAWLAAIAEPARGGYHRYLGWTMARFPVPRDWDRAVSLLAPVARAAIAGAPPSATELSDAVLKAYRVRHADLAPLLTWCLR